MPYCGVEKGQQSNTLPTRFEAAVDISRTPRSDGANDGAEVHPTRVLPSDNLEPCRTHTNTCKHINTYSHLNTAEKWEQRGCEIELLFSGKCSPRPYFTSFFRFTVVISLSGDGKAMSFFLSESAQHGQGHICHIYRN